MNNGETVFLIGIFVFLFVAWFAGGGGSARPRTEGEQSVFIGPGAILGTGENTMLPKKHWYDYLKFATSSQSDTPSEEAGDGTLSVDLSNISAYKGLVSLSADGDSVFANTPKKEYLLITTRRTLTDPITVSGWHIETAKGVKAVIPMGTGVPKMNVVNKAEPIALFGGEKLVLSSGASPVGISFKESVCTGYLGENQTFNPTLTRSCPTAYDSWRSFSLEEDISDSACSNEMRGLDRCERARDLSSDVSNACEDFTSSELTYSGCVARYRNIPTFFEPSWRVFLGSRSELYSNSRDTIYLLDEKGALVDSLSY